MLAVEPIHRCLGQAGHSVVEAAVCDVGVGGGGGRRGVAQKLGGFGPKVRLKVSFRKDDNIQKQKAQLRKKRIGKWANHESMDYDRVRVSEGFQ